MKSQRLWEVFALVTGGFFYFAGIAFADTNVPEPYPSSSPPSDIDPVWWIRALFTGFVSALVIMVAFVLDRLAAWHKRCKTRDEFVNSVCVELRHVLARLVNNCCNLRARLAKADRHTVQWHQKAYLDFDLSKVTDPAEQMAPMPQQATKPLSDNDADDVAALLNQMGPQPDTCFIHIARIEFGIINRLHFINTLIAHVRDEYDRSFTAAAGDRGSIETNKRSYYDRIADQSYFAANEVVKFLATNQASHPVPYSHWAHASHQETPAMYDKILAVVLLALSAAAQAFIKHGDSAMFYSVAFFALGAYEFILGEIKQRKAK